MSADTLKAEVDRLHAQAVDLKRELGRGRRRLQATMTRLSELRAECERRGIRLIVTPPSPSPGEEGDLHGRPQ